MALALALLALGFAGAVSISSQVRSWILDHSIDPDPGDDNLSVPIVYEWRNVSSLSVARVSPSVVMLSNGDILVTGGTIAAGTPTATTEIFNQTRGLWKPGPAMQIARVGHTATMLRDGTVLVAGGATSKGTTSSAELLNITSSASLSLPSMSFARAAHAAILLPDGKVLVTGGSDFMGKTWNQAEAYDPATHRWIPAGSMAEPRQFLTMQLLPGGDALAIGGDSGATSEKYSQATNSWSGLAQMNDKRFSSGSVRLADGRILVAGGVVNGTALRTAETFAASSGRWEATGEMAVGRGAYSLTALRTGDVLAAGSKSNAGTTNDAELFHPSNGTWSAAEPMHKSRGSQGFTVISNGTVFEIGGWSGSSITSSVEAYGPTQAKKPELCRPIDIVPLVQQADGLRGKSANGLIAKLQAAQAKYDAGENGTCVNIMDAFYNQLRAFVLSGHISLADALILYDAYSSVVRCLGGTPEPPLPVTPGAILMMIL